MGEKQPLPLLRFAHFGLHLHSEITNGSFGLHAKRAARLLG